jgi:GxxExxY protein
MKSQLIFEAETYKIIGACFEVYREKGCGFLEPVYQECMEIELRLQGVTYIPKQPLALEYKKCPLRAKYEPDFICYEKIILERKAVSELADEHGRRCKTISRRHASNWGCWSTLEIIRKSRLSALWASGAGTIIAGEHDRGIRGIRGKGELCRRKDGLLLTHLWEFGAEFVLAQVRRSWLCGFGRIELIIIDCYQIIV